MAESPHIADVSQTDFNTLVIEKSHEVPVLVDFWAPWCGPCRALSPILEQLAAEYAGKLFVAKVNTDAEQELAVSYHIRGIPAVKLFRHGAVAGEFVGVQPESTIRALIDPFIATEADALLTQAASTENNAEAIGLVQTALEKEPHNDRVKLVLVNLLCDSISNTDANEKLTECRKLLDSLSVRAAADPEVEQTHVRVQLHQIAADAPPLEALEQAVTATPDDLNVRYRLAARLALAGRYEPALEHLLEIVRHDRKFEDDGGRRMLVGIFHLLGNQHPLVVKYRGLLSRAIT